MEYFVEIIKAIAWPASIVWLGYIFRSEVRQLLGRISSFKYKDMEASFDKELAKAENEAKEIKVSNDKKSTDELSQIEQLLRIAEVSPRAAIVEAWTLIEMAASNKGLKSGVAIPRTSPKMIVDYLQLSGELSKNSLEVIEQLRKLRNQAVHMPDFAITQNEAERYLELAVQSTAIINAA
ncbi:DUF4145 domain-containing protein [Neptuniibacter sp. QD57_21]|uniref:DUF4145 domain-containing protein n=1 Tax=Neptuniibacter sp. QD57_21 TaxID=3398213 RepID=UPI0039F58D79